MGLSTPEPEDPSKLNFREYFPYLNTPDRQISTKSGVAPPPPPAPAPAQTDLRREPAQQFRASRSTRSGRPAADTDFLDGLPIRQWRQQESSVGADNSPNPDVADGTHQQGQGVWPNWGLPKGIHMYAPWCQQLLRAARAGRTIKTSDGGVRAPEQKNEDKDNGNGEEAVSDASSGFTAKRWAPVPRHMEEPEREYLAKRRKGLSSTTFVGASGVAATVSIDGTTADAMVNPDVAAGGGGEEQVRKRPPQARRKPKPKRGPGRGKKKVTATEGEGVSASAEAFAASQKHAGQIDGAGESKDRGSGGGGGGVGGERSGQPDDGQHEEEGDDDDEENGEEVEEVEGDDDDDREEGEITPTLEETANDMSNDADASALLSKFKGKEDGAIDKKPHETSHEQPREQVILPAQGQKRVALPDTSSLPPKPPVIAFPSSDEDTEPSSSKDADEAPGKDQGPDAAAGSGTK